MLRWLFPIRLVFDAVGWAYGLAVWVLDVLFVSSLLCDFKLLRVVGSWCFRPCCSGF